MQHSRKLFMLACYLGLLLILSIPEYNYQLHAIIPRAGHVLITNRLAIVIHLFLGGVIFSLAWLVFLVLHLSHKQPKENLLLSLLSILVTLVVAEALIRTTGVASVYLEKREGYYMSLYRQPTNFRPYHTHSPNQTFYLKSTEFNYSRRTNSLGLRFPELPVQKDSNEIRIMALGDSFTDGDGAPQDSAWLNSLEAQLCQFYPDKKITFINAGVCGSDPIFAYKIYKDHLAKYSPDIVFAATNMSDIDDVILRGGFERFITNDSCSFKPGPWWEQIYAVSHLFRLLFLHNSNNLLLSDSKYDKEVAISVTSIRKAFREFHSLTQKNGAVFVAVSMPLAIDFLEDHFFSLAPLNDSLAGEPYQVINLFDCYKSGHQISKSNVFDYYWKTDGHHNSKGYKAFGECIAHYVVKNNLMNE